MTRSIVAAPLGLVVECDPVGAVGIGLTTHDMGQQQVGLLLTNGSATTGSGSATDAVVHHSQKHISYGILVMAYQLWHYGRRCSP